MQIRKAVVGLLTFKARRGDRSGEGAEGEGRGGRIKGEKAFP